jgi:hypothetical protein
MLLSTVPRSRCGIRRVVVNWFNLLRFSGRLIFCAAHENSRE